MNTNDTSSQAYETKQVMEVDGKLYVWRKNAWRNYDKYRIKHRRKKFVRLVKRITAGPVAGSVLTLLSYRIFGLPLLVCIGIALGMTATGLYLRFRYVKYVYLVLVACLYVFLLIRMLLQA